MAAEGFARVLAPNGVIVVPPPGLEHMAPAEVPMNWGSFGHPELCFRPCVYVTKGGGCPMGMMCRYCHLLHGEACIKPSKKERHLLSQMSDQDPSTPKHPGSWFSRFRSFGYEGLSMESSCPVCSCKERLVAFLPLFRKRAMAAGLLPKALRVKWKTGGEDLQLLHLSACQGRAHHRHAGGGGCRAACDTASFEAALSA